MIGLKHCVHSDWSRVILAQSIAPIMLDLTELGRNLKCFFIVFILLIFQKMFYLKRKLIKKFLQKL